MSRIKLATVAQVADVVRITPGSGKASPVGTNGALCTFTLSNTRFASVTPGLPTSVTLPAGLYIASFGPFRPEAYIGFSVSTNTTLLQAGASSFFILNDTQAAAVTNGTEFMDLYLLIPLGGTSRLPAVDA